MRTEVVVGHYNNQRIVYDGHLYYLGGRVLKCSLFEGVPVSGIPEQDGVGFFGRYVCLYSDGRCADTDNNNGTWELLP